MVRAARGDGGVVVCHCCWVVLRHEGLVAQLLQGLCGGQGQWTGLKGGGLSGATVGVGAMVEIHWRTGGGGPSPGPRMAQAAQPPHCQRRHPLPCGPSQRPVGCLWARRERAVAPANGNPPPLGPAAPGAMGGQALQRPVSKSQRPSPTCHLLWTNSWHPRRGPSRGRRRGRRW
jgi:hypothetical protein